MVAIHVNRESCSTNLSAFKHERLQFRNFFYTSVMYQSNDQQKHVLIPTELLLTLLVHF